MWQVVDVGGGTGFCTQGIVKTVSPENVVLIDQSPQQLAKARNKKDLQGVSIVEVCTELVPKWVHFRRRTAPRLASQKGLQHDSNEVCFHLVAQGDAEDLPFATDSFDRYVSAGSIEYWPEPQRGIKEAYRVVKEGGLACVIGPVHPTFWLSRFFADMWMLFPTEDEYMEVSSRTGVTPCFSGPQLTVSSACDYLKCLL